MGWMMDPAYIISWTLVVLLIIAFFVSLYFFARMNDALLGFIFGEPAKPDDAWKIALIVVAVLVILAAVYEAYKSAVPGQ